MALHAHSVDRHAARFEPTHQHHHLSTFVDLLRRIQFDAVIVVGEQRGRIRLARRAKSQLDISRPSQLQPRRVAQPIRPPALHIDRFVHHVPRMQLPGIASGHRENVLREELRRVVFGHCTGKPRRQRLMPAQIVPAHLLIVRKREDHHVVRLAKIVLVGSGAERSPLQSVFRNQNARLLGHRARIIGFAVKLFGNHCAAHQHAVLRRMRAQ